MPSNAKAERPKTMLAGSGTAVNVESLSRTLSQYSLAAPELNRTVIDLPTSAASPV